MGPLLQEDIVKLLYMVIVPSRYGSCGCGTWPNVQIENFKNTQTVLKHQEKNRGKIMIIFFCQQYNSGSFQYFFLLLPGTSC
jgi:hypothetical protein